jgi:hypothetical protein
MKMFPAVPLVPETAPPRNVIDAAVDEVEFPGDIVTVPAVVASAV